MLVFGCPRKTSLFDKETTLFKIDNYDLFVIAFLDKIFKTFYHAIGKSHMDTKERSNGSTLTKQRSSWLREEYTCGLSIEICIALNTCWTKLNLLRVCIMLRHAISQLQ
jgi:hypothetical protein